MNTCEQSFVASSLEVTHMRPKPLGLESAPGCQLLLDAIMQDVEDLFPLKTCDHEAVAELSKKFGKIDGLLYSQYYYPEFDDAVLRPVYLIALTTIWIANFTKAINRNRKINVDKRQRKCQLCLLYYCFNLAPGVLPLKDEVYFEEKILRKFSRDKWMSDLSAEVQKERFLFAFEIMHYYGLEYWNPKMPEISG